MSCSTYRIEIGGGLATISLPVRGNRMRPLNSTSQVRRNQPSVQYATYCIHGSIMYITYCITAFTIA